MYPTRLSVTTAAMLAVTLCLAETVRVSCCPGMWYGRSVSVSFSDETFVDQPTWNRVQTTEPPLKASEACRIAAAHIAAAKADQLTYAIEQVAINRFFNTDHWYYSIHFESVVQHGDLSWQAMEPYRTLLATGEYPHHTNMRPRLDVFILMSGDVVPLEEM